MNLGPGRITEKLENLRKNLEFLMQPSMQFLNAHSERVEAFHRAGVVHCFSWNFPVIFVVTANSETFAALLLSDPFTKSPSPYRMKIDHEKAFEAFERAFGQPPSSVRSGIFDLPPRTRFLAISSSESWLKKSLLQESIKGTKFVSFAQRMDEETFRKIELLNGAQVTELVHATIDDDGLHLAVTAPKSLPESHKALLSEMAKVIREKMGLKPSKLSKLPNLERSILAVFTVRLEDLFDIDPWELARSFERKLTAGYEAFLKGVERS